MNTVVMIAKVSHKNKVLILFILCSVALAHVNGKCSKNCLNGNCDNTGECVCDPCWEGVNCDKYVDSHSPQFDVNERGIYINRHLINKEKPIFIARAVDKDLEISCNYRKLKCNCAEIVYGLKDENSNSGLFRIDHKKGELYLTDPEKAFDDHKYSIVITAKSAYNISETKASELHLTITIQNELYRIRREAADEKVLMTTNKEPLSRQITNFQTTFNLRTLSGEPNSLIVGNTVQYRLDVSLPRTSGIDLLVELYTKDVINHNYSPALSLYNISVSNKVAGIGFLTTGAPPKPKMLLNDINNNVYDRVILDFGSLSNNGADGNKLSVFFSVALVRKVNMTVGSKYYVTIGAEYNQGSYVWVGQSHVTTEALLPADDLRLAEVEIKATESISLDTGVTFTAESQLEFRSDKVIFEISGPSHDWEPDNVIAMGEIGVNHFGSNYQTIPNQPQHYLTERFESKSGLSFNKAILDMGLVTNIGEKSGRPSADTGNKLSFTFTIYATNYEENVGKTAPLNIQLTIGNKTVWSKSISVQITDRKHEKSIARMLSSTAKYYPTNGTQGSLTTLTISTEFSEANTFADFSVVVEVPAARKIALLEPCSARFVKEKTGFNIPYVESKLIDPKIVEGNQFVFNFGRIQLIRQRSPSKKYENTLFTEITFKIAFHEQNIEGKTLSANVKVVSGTKSIKVKTEEINIESEKKSNPPQIIVEKAVPWEELFIDGGMSVNIEMELPTNSAYEDVKIEVHGNNDSALVLPEINICRFEVAKVGPSMPCSCVGVPNINKNKVSYEKMLNKNTTLNDFSHISLGDVSVQQTPSPESERKFKLNFVAALLDGTTFQSGTNYPFFVGITIGQNTIWSTNMSFPMKLESPPDMPSNIKPNLFSNLKDKNLVIPGYTTETVIRLEIPPNTITNYSLEVLAVDEEVSICGLWISHIGKNMPCLDKDTKASYELRRIGENSRAIMIFKIVGNTGPTYLISPTDERYANTIEFNAMVRVKGSAKSNKTIQIIAKYGQSDQTIENKLLIPIDDKPKKENKEFSAPKVFKFDTAEGSRIAGIATSMLLYFDIEMEKNSQAPIRALLLNTKGYKICDAAVIRIGSNYPCFSPYDFKKQDSNFDLGMICNTFLNKEDVSENSVRLAIAVRFDSNLQEDKLIKLVGHGYVGNSTIGNRQNIEMTLKKEIEQMIPQTGEAKIFPTTVTPMPAKIRDKVWIAFNLTIPPQSTVRIMIEARGATDESRAIITVHGLRITSGGANIACPMANANPPLIFESSIHNSQHDVVKADLGYLSNFGFSHAFGNVKPGDDDITIEVLAQFSDHPMTDEASDHTVKMTAILGNEPNPQTISAAKYLRVERLNTERPIIEMQILINNSTVYDRGQVIEATALIKHSNRSTGEPANPSLRLFLPPFIQFGKIIASNSKEMPIIQNNSIGATVDIVLQWILFPDVFVINFTLIVDPENQRGYGKNETKVPTPYRIFCEHFRVSVSSKFPCSQISDFSYTARSPECYNSLGMANGLIKDCQISASSAVSSNYAPHFARYNSANYWAPSVRFWDQRQYLQVDFLKKTRVTKVVVQSLRGTRRVMAYNLMSSDNSKTWSLVNNISYLTYAEGSAHDVIKQPHEARYYRFMIEEASDSGKENDQYIALRLEFFGCYLDSEDLTNTTCQHKSDTWYSDDSERSNRHFSVDPYNNVIYFCDSTSNMKHQVCYYSNSGGSSWNIIGNSIESIEGYELASGKFYAIDYERPAYLSSKDGFKWSPESIETFNQTILHPKFQRKTTVPALHKEGLRRMNLKEGNWKALYDGLYSEDSNIPKAYWNRCCKT